ncbi:MAG TPA: ATP-binding protein [Thermomicrobiales bacterium]|nr:ATP-binding protein [Thermomicrobiales bacterium]
MTMGSGGKKSLGLPGQAGNSEDRLTMTEAARLKGVSYHTVSRAVRSGRLPVIRLGRMALISAEDLQAWEPMRERAPRKYRRAQVASDNAASSVALISSDRVDLAAQLAALYDVIHSTAAGDGLDRLAQVAVQRIAETFNLSRMSVWRLDFEQGHGERLAMHRESLSTLPTIVSLEDAPFLRGLTEDARSRVLGSPREISGVPAGTQYVAPAGPLLVVPLVWQGRSVGVMFGDRNGQQIDFSRDQLVLADMIASQLGMAIENALERERDRERRVQLETILGELSSAVSAFDAEGRLTLANAAEQELYELTDEEIELGQSALAYVSHKRVESLGGGPYALTDHPVVQALAGHQTSGYRRVIVRKDGSRRYIRTKARPIHAGGKIVGAVSVTEDITAEYEAVLREEARLAQLEREAQRSQTLADLVVEINVGQDPGAVSDIALKRLAPALGIVSGAVFLRSDCGGYEVSAVYGDPREEALNDLLAKVDGSPTASAFAQYRPILVPRAALSLSSDTGEERGSVLIVPMQIRGQRVGVAYLRFDEHRILDEGDLSFAAIWGRQCAVAIDKTMLADQVASAHGRLMAIIDQLVQAVVIVDAPEGRISMSNRAAERMWGRPLDDEQVLAATLPVVNDEGIPLSGAVHPLTQPLRTRRERVGEPLTIVRNDGAQIDVLASHSPIFDARGTVIGSVSVLQDRADFKPLDRAKDEFISVVAHELRNPLTSLRGNLQLLQRRFRKREDSAVTQEIERMDSIILQVDRINDLVGRMLDVSRADLGRFDIAAAPCDAVALVRAVTDEARGLDPLRTFVLNMPDSLPVVWDEARIEQVLRNLMQNAARYAPGSDVDIDIEVMDEDRVRITVRDHGPGVPDAIRRRLFKQYYRFDDGQEQRRHDVDGHRGLGIGLYVSARLARAHHGSLTVENAPDGGAIFMLELPREFGG